MTKTRIKELKDAAAITLVLLREARNEAWDETVHDVPDASNISRVEISRKLDLISIDMADVWAKLFALEMNPALD